METIKRVQVTINLNSNGSNNDFNAVSEHFNAIKNGSFYELDVTNKGYLNEKDTIHELGILQVNKRIYGKTIFVYCYCLQKDEELAKQMVKEAISGAVISVKNNCIIAENFINGLWLVK